MSSKALALPGGGSSLWGGRLPSSMQVSGQSTPASFTCTSSARVCFPRALGAADKQSHQLAFEGIEVRWVPLTPAALRPTELRQVGEVEDLKNRHLRVSTDLPTVFVFVGACLVFVSPAHS